MQRLKIANVLNKEVWFESYCNFFVAFVAGRKAANGRLYQIFFTNLE